MASLKPREENPKLKEIFLRTATNFAARSSGSVSATLISIDLGDFLTHRKTLASEKGHVVNAVRENKTRAHDVANALLELGIIPVAIQDFSLEHYSNLICISDGLHPLFDRYGVFAYVPSDPMLDALIAIVEERNLAWQRAMNEVGRHVPRTVRQLMDKIDDELWAEFTYDIALLIPTHFLPFNQKLLIREPDGSYLHTKVLNKELYVVVKEDSDDEIKRVCINASSKMAYHRKKYGVDTMSSRARALLEKAEKLVELLYANVMPEPGTEGAKLAAKEKAEEDARKEAERNQREPRQKENNGREGRRESLRNRAGGSGGGVEALETMESMPGASESGSNSDEARTPDGNDDDDDDELAFCAAIQEKLRGNELTNSERVEFGLRYLFGTKGYETPHIPGIPDPPSVFDRILRGNHQA
ncbi:hypothetical protein BT96DRAFT_1001004 [Gymnopus androsaceus JB14]|uniref:Uncharacterized protein n=1 Tax=Gymnopus androsaceus JB14 TaxID=1447944 RepID=A0A6A4H333_9AGAR|nr:hypothetical protein BT96DRAFT_1001004 [Gymnopus androsaceus JB14]